MAEAGEFWTCETCGFNEQDCPEAQVYTCDGCEKRVCSECSENGGPTGNHVLCLECDEDAARAASRDLAKREGGEPR